MAINTLNLIARGSLGIFALATSNQSMAQSVDEIPQDIIVTATKIGSALEKAPLAATVISSENLVRLNIQSVRAAQVRVPSLVYNDSGGSAQAYIRGIGTNSAYAGLESSVATYVDGVYLQRQVGASVDIVDLRNVEVLNGPQGSLYGRNATGGVILVNTNDPTNLLGGSMRGEVGNFGKRRVEAVINLPISEQFAFRLAGGFSHLDGFVRNIANDERLSGYDRGTVRAKLMWRSDSNLTAVASLEYHNENNDPNARRLLVGAPLCIACAIYGAQPSPSNKFYQVSQTKTRGVSIKYIAGSINLNYKSDNFDVASVTGIRNFKYKIFSDQDFASPDLYSSRAEEFGTTFTQDIYVRTHFAGAINFLVGLSGEHDTDSLSSGLFGAIFGPIQNSAGKSRVKLNSISPYGELYYKLSDSIKLTVGGRYNIDNKKLRAVNNASAVATVRASPLVEQEETYRGFTPRVILSHETRLSTIYASYSRGQKSGGFNTPAFTKLVPLHPEKLTSYEIGIKAKDDRNIINFSAAGFYYDYKDIQVSFIDAITGGVRAENAASATAYGIELNASLHITDGLTLSGGGLLERARFKKYQSAAVFCPKSIASPGYPGCPAPVPGFGFVNGRADLSGTQLPRAPDLSYFLSAEYVVPISADWNMTFLANDRYTSSYDFIAGAGGPLQLSRQKAFHLISTSLGVGNTNTGLDVRVYIDNLAKAKYYDGAPTGVYGAAGTPAAPRTYGLTIGYHF